MERHSLRLAYLCVHLPEHDEGVTGSVLGGRFIGLMVSPSI